MMKRKTLIGLLVLAAGVLAGCQDADECRIHGTVGNEQLNGKRIFLVPLKGPATAETVDSVVIKDRQFEFATKKQQMYKILMDYHYRFGTQVLLVVGEPGDITVSIDSISHASGTPQNDSLEKWKVMTERHNREYGMANRAIQQLKSQGDTAQAARMQEQARVYHVDYKNQTRRMAATMKGTLLGDFLGEMYPLTYQRKMPDGSIKTFNADTNEPVE